MTCWVPFLKLGHPPGGTLESATTLGLRAKNCPTVPVTPGALLMATMGLAGAERLALRFTSDGLDARVGCKTAEFHSAPDLTEKLTRRAPQSNALREERTATIGAVLTVGFSLSPGVPGVWPAPWRFR